MKLAEMRWPQIKKLDREKLVAVLPVGSMEQHGPHLPFQVDVYIANRLAEDLEKKMPDILLLPPVWTGVSAHHMDFPGSVTVRPRVLIDLLHDICTSLHHHGIRKIILLNGHGGNRSSLEVLGQELYSALALSVNVIVYWDLVPELLKSMKKSQSKGMGHSGELETSLMLYLAPALVSQRDIPEGTCGVRSGGKREDRSEEGIKLYKNMLDHSEVGVIGRPAAATPEDGERFYAAVLKELERAARFVQNGHK